jgi:hypothetical protein
MLVLSFLYALILPLCAVCQSVLFSILYYLYLPLTRTHLSPVWQEQIEQQALRQDQNETADQARATKPGLWPCAVCAAASTADEQVCAIVCS